jgi:hypothetical protein
MEDLTSYERRLLLGAMWRFRNETAAQLGEAGELAGDDASHEISFIDAMDSAARKLGGDPAMDLYGAPQH